jgi:hypothetical protein
VRLVQIHLAKQLQKLERTPREAVSSEDNYAGARDVLGLRKSHALPKLFARDDGDMPAIQELLEHLQSDLGRARVNGCCQREDQDLHTKIRS